MLSNVDIKKEQIKAICDKWKITEFSLFGSVLRPDFSPTSDIDVLVVFEENAKWDLFDLVTLQEELKDIFNREIDLVEVGTIRNPFRRKTIMNNREVLYAA
ncbi:MAG: nucleotidyltransferase family protein [Pseudomonadota bacterium]